MWFKKADYAAVYRNADSRDHFDERAILRDHHVTASMLRAATAHGRYVIHISMVLEPCRAVFKVPLNQ
jgi:hypothetical protein